MSLFNIIVLCIPVIVSATAALIMLMDIYDHRGKSNKLRYLLLSYFFTVFSCWLFGFFYYYYPEIFVYCNSLFLLFSILYSIIPYALTFQITRLDSTEKFSRWHLLAPALLTIAMLISSYIIPFQEQVNIVHARGAYPGGNYWYFLFFSSKLWFAIAFMLIYATLMIRHIKKYRREIQSYSSNLERSSLQWLFYSAILYGMTGALLMVISRNILVSSLWASLLVILVVFVNIQLCYNFIKENFVQIDDEPAKNEEIFSEEKLEKNPENLSEIYPLLRERFEKFVINEKSYKNPDLKITDLVEEFKINRTYISAFINQEYDMNFSRYINLLRLEEFNYLRQIPENSNKTSEQIAELSGFGSYRTYLRTSKKAFPEE